MNPDTRAAINTFPSNFGPEGKGDGHFYDEAWQFLGYDEMGKPRSLNGRLMDAHEVLNNTASASASAPSSGAAEISCKEQQHLYVRHNGGYMIPTHSKIGQGMRTHFDKLLQKYGKNELIQVYLKKNTPNFCLKREMKSEEIQCERCPSSILRQRVNSRETGMAELCACKSTNNSESTCSTHW